VTSSIGFDREISLRVSGAIIGLVLIWLVSSYYSLRCGLFTPYGIFLIAAIAFNASAPVLYLIDQGKTGFLRNVFAGELEVKILVVVTLGLMFMHLGAVLALRSPRMRFQLGSLTFPKNPQWRWMAWLFMAIGIIPSAMQLRTNLASSTANGYITLFRDAPTGAAATIPLLALYLIPGIMFTAAAGLRTITARLLVSALVCILVLTDFFLGYRSQATSLLVAYVWLINRCVWKLPRSLLIGGSIMLLLIFPAVAVMRSATADERLSQTTWIQTFEKVDDPVINSLQEMGSTLRTVGHVIRLVPESRNYDLGLSYFWSLTGVVPNFTGGLHPGAQHSLANWLSYTVDPYMAQLGGGMGFSFLAEAYLNFGWFGIVMMPALIGYAVSTLDQRAESRLDPLVFAGLATLLVFLPKYARADSAEVARYAIWYCLVPFWCCKLVQRQRRNRRGSAATARRSYPVGSLDGLLAPAGAFNRNKTPTANSA
jgi:oligosaccharide repeat unit polymerase